MRQLIRETIQERLKQHILRQYLPKTYPLSKSGKSHTTVRKISFTDNPGEGDDYVSFYMDTVFEGQGSTEDFDFSAPISLLNLEDEIRGDMERYSLHLFMEDYKPLNENADNQIHKIILHLSQNLGILTCTVPEWKYIVNIGDWEETEITFQVFDLDYEVHPHSGEFKHLVVKTAPIDCDSVFYSKGCSLLVAAMIKTKLEDYFSIPDEKIAIMFYNRGGTLLRHHN